VPRRGTDGRDVFTFNADMISSYELGSDEPSALVNTTNLFTASADQILNQMGKVSVSNCYRMADGSWSYCVYRCLRGSESLRRNWNGRIQIREQMEQMALDHDLDRQKHREQLSS
jgi:hypothetical protein